MISNYTKYMLCCFFIIFSPYVFGEWEEISQSKNATFYVDYGSVRLIDEGLKSVWILKNFKTAILEKKVKSRQLKLEMDCIAKEIRIKMRYSYSGYLLGGIPVKDYYKTEEWRSTDTDGNLKAVHEKLCRKK